MQAPILTGTAVSTSFVTRGLCHYTSGIILVVGMLTVLSILATQNGTFMTQMKISTGVLTAGLKK